MKSRTVIVFLGIAILIAETYMPLQAQYTKIKTRAMLSLDYYEASDSLEAEIRKAGGKQWWGMSIRQTDSLGNVIRETAPVFSMVYIDSSYNHAIGEVSSMLQLNRIGQLVICYDRELNVKLIFPPEVQHATLFHNGVSLVSADVFGVGFMGAIDTAGNYIFPPENELVYRSQDSCFAIKETGRQDKYTIYSFKVRLTSGIDVGSCEIYIPDEVFPVIIIPQSSNWDQFRTEEVRAMAISEFEGDDVLVQFHDGISNILSMQLARAAKCFRGVISDTDDEMLKALARKNLKEVRRLRR